MSILHPARALLFAAACTAPLPLSAQTAPSPQGVVPSPLDAKALVPAPSYESAFARYRRWGDDKAVSWRQANDTVTGIGGWRVYLREAQQPDPPPPAANDGAKKR